MLESNTCMRLSEALRINQLSLAPDSRCKKVQLVCGFTPLHLGTFVEAYIRNRFPGERASIISGLFGDVEGNLKRASREEAQGAVVVMEWSDFDARLGLRSSAGCDSQILADILEHFPATISRLERGISELAGRMPTVVVAPTLPIPPLTHLPLAQSGSFELQLQHQMIGLLSKLCGIGGLKILNESMLASRSAFRDRRDVNLEFHAGFPYTTSHAAALAELCVECLYPPIPKKGLITDLDETLWKGILGEAGPSGVSWSVESRSQAHALYQQLLASLAESGILIAVATKNDAALVREAFARRDMLLKETQVFPIESGWGAKSDSVARILRAWNLSAEDVVMVDDSPMELAEVKAKYPAIEGFRFPHNDAAEAVKLLSMLRARFAKTEVHAEDRLRLESLRNAPSINQTQSSGDPLDFLAGLDAKLTLKFGTAANDNRAFELVNKTNQFNLNGQRYTESEWQAVTNAPGAFLLTANYEDRFGPLGKIAVVVGRCLRNKLYVDIWVMSCRAFSRHIEYHVLERLFEKFGVDCIEFAFRPTERNGPLQEFFTRFFPHGLTAERFELSANVFMALRPTLFHEVTEVSHG